MKGQVITGLLVLLFFIAYKTPLPTHHAWAEVLLLLAVLVLVPVYLQTKEILRPVPAIWINLGAGLGAFVAYLFPPGPWAALFALPWFVWTSLLFLKYVTEKKEDLIQITSMAFLPAAAVWMLFDRLSLNPFGFGKDIVLLTAVHFHYAGAFFLALIGWGFSLTPDSRILRLAAQIALPAVPLTAIGITLSQQYGNYITESLSAVMVAVAGILTGIFYLNFPDKPYQLLGRIVGLSFISGMSLAVLYGIRPWIPIEWINIPFMRAVHGSINAFGICGTGLFLWYSKKVLKFTG